MNDLRNETLLSMGEAASLARSSRGGPVQIGTVRRWAAVGVGGITLETIRMGGARLTSREALERFFARQNQPEVASCA